MQARIGYCLVSFDNDPQPAKFGVIVPDQLKRKARTCFVHLHEPTRAFAEDLTGRKVLVDRWAGRPFTVVWNGKQYNFYCISQWAVLAVFNEEKEELV